MNLLLLEPEECTGPSVILHGRRAEHLLAILKVAVGDSVRTGMVNGAKGIGRVCAVQTGQVELVVDWEEAKNPQESAAPHIKLILALPRPIMLQRILRQATVLGVRHFHLIRSRRVEKSFFHTPLLHPDKTRSLLLEGLEQAMDTRLPEVSIHPRFKPFMEDVLPKLTGRGLIAHPGLELRLADFFLRDHMRDTLEQNAGQRILSTVQPDNKKKLVIDRDKQRIKTQKIQKILLAVGPEGGFSDYELQAFLDLGFTGFSMGPRILHVDTAVVSLLAQLQLLYDLCALPDPPKR